MRKTKKTIALLLVLVLLFMISVSGCQKSEGKTDPSARIVVHPSGVFPAVDETLTLTAMISLPIEISDLVDNDFTKYLEEKTNIHLDLLVTPTEGYSDKLRLALSTNDYPEVIMSSAAGSNSEVVRYGIEEKIYIPLNPYLEEYGANISKHYAESPELRDNVTAPDGNIYAISTFEGGVSHGAVGYKSWINTTWLEALGLDVPTTTEEYKKVLLAFKNGDPNGNGKADEIPLSGAYGTWAAEPYLFLLNAFDYFDTSLLKLKGETFSATANTQGFREGLSYIAELYAEGLLDPASLIQDLAQLGQLGAMNPPVMGHFAAGHIAMGVDINDHEIADQYDYLLPLKGPNGYQSIPASVKVVSSGGGFAITDKCKYPEAAIRVIDQRYDLEDAISSRFGPKGIAWEFADEGSKGVTGLDALWKQLPGMDVGGSTPVNTDWRGATVWGFPKNWMLLSQFEGDVRDSSNYTGRLLQATDAYLKYAADVDQIMPMWVDGETSDRLNNTITPLVDYVKSSIVEFITGDKDINSDADWNQYLAGLEKLGYEQYVQDYQAAYFAS